MDVKVYSTPSCSYCTMAKRYFDEKGIQYQELDVTQDRSAADEMVKISGQRAVPVIDIQGQIVVGFDKNRIESLLS